MLVIPALSLKYFTPAPFFASFLRLFSPLFSFWIMRSMRTPRSGPKPSTSQAKLWFLIYGQFSKGGICQKCQLPERPKAVNLRNVAEYLMDKVYTHIAELVTPEQILAADLQIHPVCFPEYMHKCKEAKTKGKLTI